MIRGIYKALDTPKRRVLLLAFIIVVFDRALKAYFLYSPAPPPLRFLGWLSFSLVKNSGIAFSIYLRFSILVAAVIVAIIGLVILFSQAQYKKDYHAMLGIFIILFGALSNLYDRIRYGFVIDYIDVKYFTVFNLSDVLITFGILYLVYFELKKPRVENIPSP